MGGGAFWWSVLVYITLIALVLWNRRHWWYSYYARTSEAFSQCVYRPKGKHIYSIPINISIPGHRSTHEFSLIEFRTLIDRASLRRHRFLNDLNRLPEVARGKRFEEVYRIADDVLLYREPAFHGFHVRFDERDRPRVLGVVNHYDIVSQYVSKK